MKFDRTKSNELQKITCSHGCSADEEIRDRCLCAKECPARFGRDDLGDHAGPRIGSEAAAQSLPDEKHKGEDQACLQTNFGKQEGDQGKSQKWNALMDGCQQHGPLVAAQLCSVVGSE